MSDRGRELSKAHRKIGAARKIVEGFWASRDAANPRNHDTAFAMHVALVQLADVLKRGAKV